MRYVDMKFSGNDIIDNKFMPLTKRNLMAMSKIMNIPTRMFPSPTARNMGHYVYDNIRYLSLRYNLEYRGDFELFCIWYLISLPYASSKMMVRDTLYLHLISDTCYYLAYNGLKVINSGSVSHRDIEKFSECEDVPESIEYFLENFDKLCISILPHTEQIKEKKTKAAIESILIDPDSDVPIELQSYLQNCKTVAELVHLVCKIQMLSPKYKRAEDAFDSLLNAWNTMSKE